MSAFKIIRDSKRTELSKEEINNKLIPFNLQISNIKLKKLKLSHTQKTNKKEEPFESFYFNNEKFIHFKISEHPRPPQNHFERRNLTNNHFKREFKRDFRNRPDEIILIDKLNESEFKNFWLIVLLIIDILLISFLLFLRAKLKPLLGLKENMIRLSKGEVTVLTTSNGKDEVSQIAKEFDNAMNQLKQLRESRNLFLRNIMHELKTPITKGKLISDTLEENERKFILIRVFQRLEYLLSEFAKIEELTSGKIKLDKNRFRAADLIDQALDILLLDSKEIDIHYNFDLILNVDFDLFSISLKNLIDNAIKYNTNGNPEIFIEENCIKILNKGNSLKKNINEYYKPFNHEYETAEKGLGLGLYISNNIIKIHNFELRYKYKSEFHSFIINVN